MNELKSIVRIAVAALVGMLFTWLSNYVEITPEQVETVTQVVFTVVFYGLARLSEMYWPKNPIASRVLMFKKPKDV